MKFVEKEIIMPFGSPESILIDIDQKFDCMAVHDFTKKHDTTGSIHQRIIRKEAVL